MRCLRSLLLSGLTLLLLMCSWEDVHAQGSSPRSWHSQPRPQRAATFKIDIANPYARREYGGGWYSGGYYGGGYYGGGYYSGRYYTRSYYPGSAGVSSFHRPEHIVVRAARVADASAVVNSYPYWALSTPLIDE